MTQQYGDIILQTDELPDAILQPLLEAQIREFAAVLGVEYPRKPAFFFNVRWMQADPETGDLVETIGSGWKADL